MAWDDWLKLIGIGITAISAISAACSAHNSYRQYLQSKQLDVFNSYTKRYNEIINSSNLAHWHSALKGDESHYDKMEPCMVQYLNLVWEEWYLRKNNLISKKLWKIWEPEIRKNLETDFARRVITKYDLSISEILSQQTR